ncbi:hypothetical protein T492DRAFT_978243, partial [Pavlovales sp. CCMP2436]
MLVFLVLAIVVAAQRTVGRVSLDYITRALLARGLLLVKRARVLVRWRRVHAADPAAGRACPDGRAGSRMPGWPHGPLSPLARRNPRQAGPHEASTRHPRCRAVLALCAQPGTRSAGEGLLARCTQPRRLRVGAAC